MSSTSPPFPPPVPSGAAGSLADAPGPSSDRTGTVVPFPRRSEPVEPVDVEPVDGPAADGIELFGPDEQGAAVDHRDWAWVEEWRDGAEPTPWAPGLAVAGFATLVVGLAVIVLSAGLAGNPVVAVLVNLLVAAGLVPAIWLSRELPVLRWVGWGAAVGVLGGWIVAIGMVAG